VAILPYYVANLNIEATYAAITGDYEEFKNLCFVDTLDNVGLHTAAHGTTADLFGSVSEENVARIKRQNSKKISVVIGNPPYNANQANENDNNKNREYPAIDARIKQTYIAESTAQKTKLYDMYARFFRWASDRLHADGVLAFVTNRSFVDSRTFDGFRKTVAQEFADIYVVDLGGDVRANPKLSGTKHNVFGIQTGVAISFFVKRQGASGKKGCRVFYARRPEMETAEEKLAWLGSARASTLGFEEVRPDGKGNWLNLTSNDFDELIPLADRETKLSETASRERAIAKVFSLGTSTNRDEWVIDVAAEALVERMKFFVSCFEKVNPSVPDYDLAVKWSRNLKRRFEQGRREAFSQSHLKQTLYRPFVAMQMYDSPLFVDERGATAETFPDGAALNMAICVIAGDRQPFAAVASRRLPNLNLYSADATKFITLWRFSADGQRHDNITDWSLTQFRKHYQPGRSKSADALTKEAIFHYVYAVLHDPLYREKYAQNLKRDFPRIPLYGITLADFQQWAAWGEELMALHIGYETVDPLPLKRTDTPDLKVRAAGQSPKCLLKADAQTGRITLDSETALSGIPAQAWLYKLGNRCALEWVLDQHKEKKPKDPTIREKFDTYRFADHKEHLVTLLGRVARVSVETVRIVEALKAGPR
jgi:predicted helicase